MLTVNVVDFRGQDLVGEVVVNTDMRLGFRVDLETPDAIG
jgi:hypothetical protein